MDILKLSFIVFSVSSIAFYLWPDLRDKYIDWVFNKKLKKLEEERKIKINNDRIKLVRQFEISKKTCRIFRTTKECKMNIMFNIGDSILKEDGALFIISRIIIDNDSKIIYYNKSGWELRQDNINIEKIKDSLRIRNEVFNTMYDRYSRKSTHVKELND